MADTRYLAAWAAGPVCFEAYLREAGMAKATTLADLPVASYQLIGGELAATLDRVEGFDGTRWAIRQVGACLNKRGKWEYEPIPSSRTEAFFKRCRWNTAEAALAFWLRSGAKSRFAHLEAARDPDPGGRP